MTLTYTVTVVNRAQAGENILTTVVLQAQEIESQLTLSNLVNDAGEDFAIGDDVPVEIKGGK